MSDSVTRIPKFDPDKITNTYIPSDRFLDGDPDKPLYPMTNDYMFRAVLQRCHKVLKVLICSLLHLDESQVQSVDITNPIVLGEQVGNKEIRLDVCATLNDHDIIDIEMQIGDRGEWEDRSLVYACNLVSDSVSRGDTYSSLRPVIHIGFIDFIRPDAPERFVSRNELVDIKNLKKDLAEIGEPVKYNGKFRIDVVNLRHIDLADDEDKYYGIDRWARLFMARTWEELKVVAENEPAMVEAANAVYSMNDEYWIRKRCRDRLDYERHMVYLNQERDKYKALWEESTAELEEKNRLIAELQMQLGLQSSKE